MKRIAQAQIKMVGGKCPRIFLKNKKRGSKERREK